VAELAAGVERGDGDRSPRADGGHGGVSGPGLERTYRRWLRWYPRWFRAEQEDDLPGVLLAGDSPRSWPGCSQRGVASPVTGQ